MTTTIENDLHCITCGYNLRTLSAEAACPECGAAVSKSIPTDTAPWLAAVRRGLSLQILVVITGVIYTFGVATINWLLRKLEIYNSTVYLIYDVLYYSVDVLLALLFLWSNWKIGTPRSGGHGPLACRRRWLRKASVVYAALYFAVMAWAGGLFGAHFKAVPLAATLRTLENLSYLLRDWLCWICIGYVLRSIQQVPMAVHAAVIRWIQGGLNLILLLRLYTMWLSFYYVRWLRVPVRSRYPAYLEWIDWITGIGALVIGVWTFIFIIRARGRVASIEPAGYIADLKYFAGKIGGSFARGWRFFVERLRYHGPPDEEKKKKDGV